MSLNIFYEHKTLMVAWLFFVSHINSGPVEFWVIHIEAQLDFCLFCDSTLGTHPSITYLDQVLVPHGMTFSYGI